ncbi:MAG TPA: hypothetical protein VH092_32205 [Urbifossiella sp.]|jgi:hypothetical protein|nr:hypothetical protein [Urbifossiella sp.]
MTERRPLVAGLKGGGGLDPAREKAFVFGEKAEELPTAKPHVLPADPREGKGPPAGWVPLTTRVRGDWRPIPFPPPPTSHVARVRPARSVFDDSTPDPVEAVPGTVLGPPADWVSCRSRPDLRALSGR